jgi:hypothetical protein
MRKIRRRGGLKILSDFFCPGPSNRIQTFTQLEYLILIHDFWSDRSNRENDSVTELVDAWKVPSIPPAEPRAKVTGARLECVPDARQDAVPRTMDFADAQRIRDRAWLESVAELESAWKGPAR